MNPFRKFRLLDGLWLRDIACLMQCSTREHLDRGERLFTEAEEAKELFLIEGGSVGVETCHLGHVRFNVASSGDILGTLCASPTLWPATGYALEPTDVIVLNCARLRHLMEQDRESGLRLAVRLSETRAYANRMQSNRAEWGVTVFELSENPSEGVVSL